MKCPRGCLKCYKKYGILISQEHQSLKRKTKNEKTFNEKVRKYIRVFTIEVKEIRKTKQNMAERELLLSL